MNLFFLNYSFLFSVITSSFLSFSTSDKKIDLYFILLNNTPKEELSQAFSFPDPSSTQSKKKKFTIALSEKRVEFKQISVNKLTTVNLSPKGDTIKPGDTIIIEPGLRKNFLRIVNLSGSPKNPIVVINGLGKVIIHNEDKGGGLVFRNCNFIHITGTGHPQIKYGIKIDTAYLGATGMGIEEFSNHFEIDHIEICNTGFAGLMVKTDPSCDSLTWMRNFEMKGIRIHDNYIHHTRGEGMYIGFSKPAPYKKRCGTDSLTVTAHRIKDLKIYNNVVSNTGFDGIQIGCATEAVEVYKNDISLYGQRCDKDGRYYGMTGIVIGGGSCGAFYKNRLTDGMGSAFQIFGEGDIFLFDNTIIRAGQGAYCSEIKVNPSSIFADDRTKHEGYSIFIFNNTIVDPSGNAIDFRSRNHKNNVIVNNLIITHLNSEEQKSLQLGKVLVKSTQETVVNGNIILSESKNEGKELNKLNRWFKNIRSDDYRLTQEGRIKLKSEAYSSEKLKQLLLEEHQKAEVFEIVGAQ